MDDARKAQSPIKGRGAASYVDGRYAVTVAQGEDDGWGSVYEDLADAPGPQTRVTEERARSIVSRNDSPDVGHSASINPYRGCEHGCVYCFARPSHAYLDLSPGLDFETRLFAKTNAAELLQNELARPSYKCVPLALGINTDSYQPIERRYRVTRSVIEVLGACSHPFSVITKNAGVVRDLDLIAPLARRGLVSIAFSVTSLDNRLSARMEPRASAPHARLKAIRTLVDAGVPVGVMVAPVIPMINDREIEHILEACRDHGATSAGYVLLRLPHELKQVWREWLQLHYPDRADHVMSLIQQMRGGKDYDSTFGTRMRGEGPFAQLIAQRFRKAHARLGFSSMPELDTTQFVPPRKPSPQGELF
ncbi:PA0069 family radical SAM protein [Lysobacter arvi]|uniref:PA0069 family radical SAM protein n=1 Tax=Lysobacter arvi TaxID=3038776 RepID=A0ABU1CHP6_9GAMM|nr:PA0069 family radical SAM protein [Lysobacter arvi]MDR0184457.1 PA0069 family radical SAM protein [Lysobacter arvi]